MGAPQIYRSPPPQDKAGGRGKQGNSGLEGGAEKAHRPHQGVGGRQSRRHDPSWLGYLIRLQGKAHLAAKPRHPADDRPNPPEGSWDG